MSAPSSPASSPRGSSPAFMLSPGAKVKALLATVESSDEEGGAPTTHLMKKNAGRPTVPSAPTRLDDDEDDSESDVDIRPRGRLAARMLADTTSRMGKETQNARQRVIQMLEREQEQEKSGQDQEEDDDDDDDLPVVSRKIRHDRAHQSTPVRDAQKNKSNSVSPGLFVSSPAKTSPARSTQQNDSDSDDLDLPAIHTDRFKALVEKKRRERLAREAKEEAERAERRARQEHLASELDALDSHNDDVADISDDEGGQTLTQKSVRRPRKASKRANEEMNRETQRLTRSMQLAPEIKTRKKITMSSLFERFNYIRKGQDAPAPISQPNSSSRPSTPPSDAENATADTPPSSPPSADKALQLAAPTESVETVNKGKGKAIEVPSVPVNLSDPLKKTIDANSDDELEIIDDVSAKADQDSHSLLVRSLTLARLPDRNQNQDRNNAKKMTNSELQAYLLQKARQQAKDEKARRLERYKKFKGIDGQTMSQQVEDIVAKAREKAQRLMELEREAAKKDGKENAEANPLAWDDSDEEYEASDREEEEEDVEAIELSGSEDEEIADADESDYANSMFVEEADEPVEEQESECDEDDDMEQSAMQPRCRRPRNITAVLSDDEDAGIKATPKPVRSTDHTSMVANNDSPAAPCSVLRSAKKSFIPGLPVTGPAGLGLTQIFAGTMDDSQSCCSDADGGGPTQSMMPDFDNFPDSNFSATMNSPTANIIEDSQPTETQDTTQGIRLDMSQSQMHGLDSLMRDDYPESQNIEFSQDGGFQTHTPLKDRFVDPPFSTIATDVVADTMGEDVSSHASPLLGRGRLRRKADLAMTAEPSQHEPATAPCPAQDVFAVMKEQAKQKQKRRLTHDFNSKTSKAREMVEQEAEESDDEYAGLGGMDGEDSDNESSASVKEMIDDDDAAATNDADQGQLAAFYADRARAEDKQQIEQLFKDVTTGKLRRKRGADFDLSDSEDDDGEARRRMKRRQFSKMQKALFADERVRKIADDPGNQAFLRTIEDRGSDDEMNILEMVDSCLQRVSPSPGPETQQGGDDDDDVALRTIPDSQPGRAAAAAVGTAAALASHDGGNRASARTHRTKKDRKPFTIDQVRETLSSLLEEPASLVAETEAGSSDSEDGGQQRDDRDKENRSPPRRTAVVDRIGLDKRSDASSSSTSGRGGGRMAFMSAAASASGLPFKVPSLLRRATTNSSFMSSTSSTTTTTTTIAAAAVGAGFGGETRIKKVAGRRSGVVHSSRAVPESDGRARMRENERRREEKKMKGAEKRLGVVGGLFGRGSFT